MKPCCCCCSKNINNPEKKEPSKFDNEIPETIEKIYEEVSKKYKTIIEQQSNCDCKVNKYALSLGYTSDDIKDEKYETCNLSCGNPIGISNIKKGEIIMDLGCGSGFDCRLAAKKVGFEGKVFGIDMTKEMIDKAKEITNKEKYPQIEFIQSKIEDIGSFNEFLNKFDLVISNCVFNLSPQKDKVLKGVFQVLKKGGRLIFSDPVALKEIPEETRKSLKSYTACMSNACLVDDLYNLLKDAGFENIKIEVKDNCDEYIKKWTPESHWENGVEPKEYIATASIFAYKPM